MRTWAIAGVFSGAVVIASVVLAAGDSPELVGANRCRECHPAAYQAWQQSAHRRAHDALAGGHEQESRCVQCHGGGERLVAGVQCESCHGPGTAYSRTYVMKDRELSRIVGLVDVTEEVCRRCHTETSPSTRVYDHTRMWGTIEHGRDVQVEEEAQERKGQKDRRKKEQKKTP